MIFVRKKLDNSLLLFFDTTTFLLTCFPVYKYSPSLQWAATSSPSTSLFFLIKDEKTIFFSRIRTTVVAAAPNDEGRRKKKYKEGSLGSMLHLPSFLEFNSKEQDSQKHSTNKKMTVIKE